MKYQTYAGIYTAAGLMLLASFATVANDDTAAAIPATQFEFFATLKDVLPGRWEGAYADGTFDDPTSEWTPLRVDYYLTAGGTAIIEDYLFGRGPGVGMSTVYHLDNNDIRATHFCGARNHPRMISRAFDADSQTLSLGFVDVANLAAPENYHSRSIDLRIVDENNVRVLFHGLENGSDSVRVFDLHRIDARD